MKVKKKIILFTVVSCLILVVLFYFFIHSFMKEKEFQHMPEIYEIPNTSQIFTQNNITTIRKNYMIKNECHDLELLHEKIQHFIYDDNIINTLISYSETGNCYINLRFYRISEQLPFDFEQILGFGGDVIANHSEDMIAEVCLFPNSSDQLYYTLISKTPNDENGYNEVIEETSFYENLQVSQNF